MNNRRGTDEFKDRLQAVESSCVTMGKCIEINTKMLEEQGKSNVEMLAMQKTANEQTAGVVKAFEDANTWIRVSKWAASIVALISVAVIGVTKLKFWS